MFKGLEDDEDEDTELSKMTQVQVMHGKERAAISMEQAEEQYIENENSQNEKRDDKTQELNALMQKTGEISVSQHSNFCSCGSMCLWSTKKICLCSSEISTIGSCWSGNWNTNSNIKEKKART